jgi:hypothetical protein
MAWICARNCLVQHRDVGLAEAQCAEDVVDTLDQHALGHELAERGFLFHRDRDSGRRASA